jgi:ABC-2 type transport system permease protein
MAIVFGSIVAALVFGLVLPPLILPFLASALILSLFAITLGIISCTIILRLGSTAEWFAWPVPAVLQPFVGVFYPIAVLPLWAQAIAQSLPPTYVFENLREVLSGGEVVWNEMIFAMVLSFGYIAVSSWLFVRTYRWALRTGAISRFGSESF